MRALRLALALVSPALTGGAMVAAQTVERTDVPDRGMIRFTFDPRIMTWNSEFTDAGRLGLGRGLTGDTVGSAYIPSVARLEQDVRLASGVAGFVASLGQGRLSVREERRTYPITAELGLTDRLSVSVMVPIVRVATRTAMKLSPQGSNLGLNPRLTDINAPARYQSLFTQFDAALAQLDQNIASGMYGCPPSRQCQAQDSLMVWRAIRDALDRSVDSLGATFQPFLPRDSSDAGKGILRAVATIQQDLATLGVGGVFTDTLLLPSDTVDAQKLSSAIVSDPIGFGYRGLPFRHLDILHVDAPAVAEWQTTAPEANRERPDRLRVPWSAIPQQLAHQRGGYRGGGEVPLRGGCALRRHRSGAGAPPDGRHGFGRRFAAPVDRRSPDGPRGAARPRTDRGAGVAQRRAARGAAAPRHAGAPRGAVVRAARAVRGDHGAALGPRRLPGSGRRAARAPRAAAGRRVHGRLLDEGAGPLHVPQPAGLDRSRHTPRNPHARERARRGHVPAVAAARVRVELRGQDGRGRVLHRADRHRRGGRAGRDAVSDRLSDFAEAVLRSSAAWRSAVSMSASPSMRASSRVRASPVTTWTSLVATPRCAPFATTSW